MLSVDIITTHWNTRSIETIVQGGQAFAIKLRPTKERSTSSMLLEPPFFLNGSDVDPALPPRWRQMKYVHSSVFVVQHHSNNEFIRHACGKQ
jgi:hypothetical protein